jgi:hypothetical protein
VADTVLTQVGLNLLAEAFLVDGALPALRNLCVDYSKTPMGDLSKLIKALASGASPLLEHLTLRRGEHVEFRVSSANNLLSIIDMMEARAPSPGCKGLKSFTWSRRWLCDESQELRMRLLRVLLPSFEVLPQFEWDVGLEPCFWDIQAPNLTALDIFFEQEQGEAYEHEEDGTAFS